MYSVWRDFPFETENITTLWEKATYAIGALDIDLQTVSDSEVQGNSTMIGKVADAKWGDDENYPGIPARSRINVWLSALNSISMIHSGKS